MQTIVESDSAETIKFYWKVSSEQGGDYLQFYIDSTLKDQISGEVGWQQKSYSVPAGIHILRWCYVKDSSGSSGSDCAWVDFVQWSGPSPTQNPSNWQQIAYKHDVTGRRVEKKVDGCCTRYVYDGPHVIAEYDGNNNLLRKYIYGACIDEPICMIEVADSNATYYYHYDALGSVVALSDSTGDTVQTYEYSVFGEVAVEDANHPNPYMFAGVRYDIEIGLYYNRARYYNPFVGRFLQTDPIADGMNLYAYCGNGPTSRADPSGLSYRFLTEDERVALGEQYRNRMVFADVIEGADACIVWDGNDIEEWLGWASGYFGEDWAKSQSGWAIASGAEVPGNATAEQAEEIQVWWFWRIKALMFLDESVNRRLITLNTAVRSGRFKLTLKKSESNYFTTTGTSSGVLEWNAGLTSVPGVGTDKKWCYHHALAALSHELFHAWDHSRRTYFGAERDEVEAVKYGENRIRKALFSYDPTEKDLWPRPGVAATWNDVPGNSAAEAWGNYDERRVQYWPPRRRRR